MFHQIQLRNDAAFFHVGTLGRVLLNGCWVAVRHGSSQNTVRQRASCHKRQHKLRATDFDKESDGYLTAKKADIRSA